MSGIIMVIKPNVDIEMEDIVAGWEYIQEMYYTKTSTSGSISILDNNSNIIHRTSESVVDFMEITQDLSNEFPDSHIIISINDGNSEDFKCEFNSLGRKAVLYSDNNSMIVNGKSLTLNKFGEFLGRLPDDFINRDEYSKPLAKIFGNDRVVVLSSNNMVYIHDVKSWAIDSSGGVAISGRIKNLSNSFA